MPVPIIRTPFTDVLPASYSHQMFGRCMKFEDRFLQCQEAYGRKLSLEKCKDFSDDLDECNKFSKQLKRVELMQRERRKQIRAGQRKGNEYMEPPEFNSYGGTFFGYDW